MSENKKMVEAITPINEDFAQWYTDICLKAELVDYSAVKGCVILRPYGYAIWENIMHLLDRRFKETGHENVAMPLFIPESLLQKEKDLSLIHICKQLRHALGHQLKAFAQLWVEHGGDHAAVQAHHCQENDARLHMPAKAVAEQCQIHFSSPP